MQRRAAEDLQKLVTDALVERGFVYEGAKAFATPRRLALARRRPARAGRRTCARSARARASARPSRRSKASSRRRPRLASTEAKIEQRPKKGEFYVAVDREAGPPDAGGHRRDRARRSSAPSRGRNRCAGARPPRSRVACAGCARCTSIVCTFGPETEEPEVVAFEVDGIRSGDVTYGHRFMAPDADQGAPLRRLRARRWSRPRSCSTPTAARTSSSPTPRTSPSRRASSWSRTRACSRRSPASSNGRWC